MWCWKTNRLGRACKVARSIRFASTDTTGTLNKVPIALRKRCSSTFPEFKTSVVHELPLRLAVRATASSREGTPLARRISTSDLLRAGLMGGGGDWLLVNRESCE